MGEGTILDSFFKLITNPTDKFRIGPVKIKKIPCISRMDLITQLVTAICWYFRWFFCHLLSSTWFILTFSPSSSLSKGHSSSGFWGKQRACVNFSAFAMGKPAERQELLLSVGAQYIPAIIMTNHHMHKLKCTNQIHISEHIKQNRYYLGIFSQMVEIPC